MPLDKRTREWMSRNGMGEAYYGTGRIGIERCAFDRKIPNQIVLEHGDENVNRSNL